MLLRPRSRISHLALNPTSHCKRRIRSQQMTCDKEPSPQDMGSCPFARQRTHTTLARRRKLVKHVTLLSCAMPSHPFRQPVRKQHNRVYATIEQENCTVSVYSAATEPTACRSLQYTGRPLLHLLDQKVAGSVGRILQWWYITTLLSCMNLLILCNSYCTLFSILEPCLQHLRSMSLPFRTAYSGQRMSGPFASLSYRST